MNSRKLVRQAFADAYRLAQSDDYPNPVGDPLTVEMACFGSDGESSSVFVVGPRSMVQHLLSTSETATSIRPASASAESKAADDNISLDLDVATLPYGSVVRYTKGGNQASLEITIGKGEV